MASQTTVPENINEIPEVVNDNYLGQGNTECDNCGGCRSHSENDEEYQGEYQDEYQGEYQDEYQGEYQEIDEQNIEHDHDCENRDDSNNYSQEERQSPQLGPITLHKSSKELYKAVAKQFGISCKMSDGCRCFDCQSHYFECEYEENEQEKTDGGLGAGTPVFISEVMHGAACNIL